MKLTKKEKRELQGDGSLYLSVDVGWFSYEDHLKLHRKLKRFGIMCNIVPGGTAIYPDTAGKVRKTRRICKKMRAYLKDGVTSRMRM